MMKKDIAALVKLVACKTCMKEIPISEAHIAEASDYVAHFCGVTCYDKWKNQPAGWPLTHGMPPAEKSHHDRASNHPDNGIS